MGIKTGTIIGIGGCEACLALYNKTFSLNKLPELPYQRLYMRSLDVAVLPDQIWVLNGRLPCRASHTLLAAVTSLPAAANPTSTCTPRSRNRQRMYCGSSRCVIKCDSINRKTSLA